MNDLPLHLHSENDQIARIPTQIEFIDSNPSQIQSINETERWLSISTMGGLARSGFLPGVIRGLEKLKIRVDVLAPSSTSAQSATAMGLGHSIDEVEEILQSFVMSSLYDFRNFPRNAGLVSADKLFNFLRSYIKPPYTEDTSIEQVKSEFINRLLIYTSNAKTRTAEVIKQDFNIIDAVYVSATFPLFVQKHPRYPHLVDGDLLPTHNISEIRKAAKNPNNPVIVIGIAESKSRIPNPQSLFFNQ